MATFKVGQRVRIVMSGSHFLGREATITAARGAVSCFAPWPSRERVLCNDVYRVRLDDGTDKRPDAAWLAYDASDLAPLTDPKAEQFIESIKRLKPYDEPKVREREWDLAMGEKK